jgi:hypothetical protein
MEWSSIFGVVAAIVCGLYLLTCTPQYQTAKSMAYEQVKSFAMEKAKEKFLGEGNMMSALDSMARMNEAASKPPKVYLEGRSLVIEYHFDGRECVKQLPYDRRKNINTKVHLIDNDGNIYYTKHDPRLPYLMTANSLGMKMIRVSNEEKGHSKEYIGDEQVELI